MLRTHGPTQSIQDHGDIADKILVISLFSGIGFMEYPFKKLLPNRHEIILFVEKNPNARKIFSKNFNSDNHNIKFIEDILDLKPKEEAQWIKREYPNNQTIFVTAGFPCTTFSLAGAKNGLDDNSNAMLEKVVSLIKALDEIQKDVIFIMENVSGLKSDYNETAFESIKRKLSCGDKFHISCDVLDSINFDVPQKRKRLYLIATNMRYRMPFLAFNHDKSQTPQIKQIVNFKDKALYKKRSLRLKSASRKVLKKKYNKLKARKNVAGISKKKSPLIFSLYPQDGSKTNFILMCKYARSYNNKNRNFSYASPYKSFPLKGYTNTLTKSHAKYFSFYKENKKGKTAIGRHFSVEEIAGLQGMYDDNFNFCKELLAINTIKELIGNAVTVPVMQAILGMILTYYYQNKNPYSNTFFSKKNSFISCVQKNDANKDKLMCFFTSKKRKRIDQKIIFSKEHSRNKQVQPSLKKQRLHFKTPMLFAPWPTHEIFSQARENITRKFRFSDDFLNNYDHRL